MIKLLKEQRRESHYLCLGKVENTLLKEATDDQGLEERASGNLTGREENGHLSKGRETR